jgi:type IV pilus assembly protein PilW
LSLVELMIAMALGLVLTLGVLQVFTSSSQAYRLTDSLSNLQENMRFATSRLQYETRLAGFRGCLIGDPFNNLDTGDPAYDPLVYNQQMAVVGWEGDGTDIGDAYTNTDFDPANNALTNGTGDAVFANIANEALPGTDVVVINNAQRLNLTLNGNPGGAANTIVTAGNTGVPAGRVLLAIAANCTGADLFQKTNAANSASLTKGGGAGITPGNQAPVNGGFSTQYTDNARIYEYASSAFYIAQGVDGGPALFMRRLDAGNPFGGNAVELVNGVENLQVLYGIANPGGRTVQSYVSADGVADWADVVSVRFGLLLRSEDNVQDEAAARVYNLQGTAITTENDRRARMVGTLTVGIRNRLE